MKLTNEFDPIRGWAEARGIFISGDPKTQFIKLVEEVGELAAAMLKENSVDVSDALGDCVIVLVSIAKLWERDHPNYALSLESAINNAYEVIANRVGTMQNGTFIKK